MSDGLKLVLCGLVLVAGLVTWSVIDRMDQRAWPLQAEENPVKLGLVDEEVQQVQVILKNHGTVPIRIVAVNKGCTCQSVELPEPVVLPGKAVPVHVNLDCRGRAGPFRTAIEVDYQLEESGKAKPPGQGTVLTEPVVLEAVVKPAPFEAGRDLEFPAPPGASGQIVQSFRFTQTTGDARRIAFAESWNSRIRVEVIDGLAMALFVDVADIPQADGATIEIRFDEPDSRAMRSSVRFLLPEMPIGPDSDSVSSLVERSLP